MKLQEMDFDGFFVDLLVLVLVDELVYSNVFGSCYVKCWQDIQELLVVGIDVYIMVNVQYLESFNDQVCDIIGVQVCEMVLDWVLQEVYEIVFIDLLLCELLECLCEGKVYVLEQVWVVIDVFFLQINFIVLCELVMQIVVVWVDVDFNYCYCQCGEEVLVLCGWLLVGIDGDEQVECLVCYVCWVVECWYLFWSVVYVDIGGLCGEQVWMCLQGVQ